MSNPKIKIFNSQDTRELENKINEFLTSDKVGFLDIKYYSIPADIEQWKDDQADTIMMRHDCIFTALVIYRQLYNK